MKKLSWVYNISDHSCLAFVKYWQLKFKSLHPDQVISTFITNRTGVEGGLAEVTDGDLGTHALIKSPNSIQTGDYIGLKFNKAVPIQNLTFAMGTQANPRDTLTMLRLSTSMKMMSG